VAKLKEGLSEEYLTKPYEPGSDPLSRYELAEQLATLYANLEHGSVAILNGRWGSGKSVFARKLISHLRNR
jgi:tRNA A37 threonylcarbamoyladenosine biosynthesis protein TsaE